MDPRYMDICGLDTLSIAPLQQKRKKKKRSYGIKVGLDLFRFVSLLGFGH